MTGGMRRCFFSILWPISKDQLEIEKTEETGRGLNLSSFLLVAQ